MKAEDAATRLNVLNRSALRPVQAQARTPVVQTSTSYAELTPRRCSSVPHSTSRQNEYIKVGSWEALCFQILESFNLQELSSCLLPLFATGC